MPTASWRTSSRPWNRLATFLLSGRIVPELQQEDLREVIHGNYRLEYRVPRPRIAILTVFHPARLLSADVEQRRG